MKKLFSYLTMMLIMLSASVSAQIQMPEDMTQGEPFTVDKVEKGRKKIQRAGEQAILQGYVSFNTDNKIGWYTLNDKGEATFAWTDALATEKASPMVFGWIRNGKLCGVSSRYESGVLYSYDYLEIDLATGEYTLQQPINMRNDDKTVNFLNYYRVAAYDPYTDRVYGYGYNEDGKKYVFKSSAYDFSETTIIREVADAEFCSSITYNSQEKRLVGFNRVEFVAIDAQTGNQTLLYYPELGNFQYTYSGMVYDKASRTYYWNYVTKDNKTHLVQVDFNAKKMTKVCDYTNMTIFSFLVPMAEDVDPTAPEAPVVSAFNFDKNALSGSVEFTLPAKSNNGDALAAGTSLAWTLEIDGAAKANGTGLPGASVTQNVENLTEGNHTFMVVATLGDKESDPAIAIKYVGNDTPVAPENILLNESTVTWNAVTKGLNDGYVDSEAIEYEVTLNGVALGSTAETSIDVTYPANAEYRVYSAKVVAKYAGKLSSSGTSNNFLFGKPISVPKNFSPDVADQYLFTAEDKDGDGNMWKHNDGAKGQEFFISGAGSSVDEWLFFPPLNCNSETSVYSISFNAALTAETDKNAKIEVFAGAAANSDAMTLEVMPLTDVSKTSLTEFAGLFVPTADLAANGTVLGIHVKGNAQVKARNFKIAKTTLSPKAPQNLTDVVVKAKDKGELKVDVSFTMPTKLIDGSLIDANTDITVEVRGDSKKTVTGKAGSKQTATVEAYQGFNEIEVTPAIGSDKGQKRIYDVYAGNDIPAGVQNFKIAVTEDNNAAYCTWEAPAAVGVNGGYVNPDDIEYWVCEYDKTTHSWKPMEGGNLGKELYYYPAVNPGTRLGTYQFAIQAVSSAGSSPVFVPARVQLGKPYEMPINERFVNSEMEPKVNYPITVEETGDYEGTEWKISNPELENPAYAAPYGVALMGTNEGGGTKGCVYFSKFSTKDQPKATVSFYVFQSKKTPKITVWANTFGMTEDEKLGELSATGEGYTKKTIELPEKFLDKNWVCVYLTVDYTEANQYTLISQYTFSNTGSPVDDVVGSESSVVILPLTDGVMIAGAEGAPVDVYSLNGMLVKRIPVAASEEVISLNSGLYIVRAADRTAKIFVK